MKNIDEYIAKAANMKNTSDGGSPAYHFEDVVLVKYRGSTKYGRTRPTAELIAQKANEKNAEGVKTPAHLAIKRVIVDDKQEKWFGEDELEICWVLQERAKGKNFNSYCYNQDSKTQLDMQSILANAPDSHYEKLVSDVSELLHLGLELKPKNMFYDESLHDGGFTIIDLLGVTGEPFNSHSFKDIMRLDGQLQCVCNFSRIDPLNEKESERDREISKQHYFKMRQKIFSAMEKAIPNFEQHRRWYLRTFPVDVLDFFEKNGTYVGDLSLNEQEYEQFNQNMKKIIDESIATIENGEKDYSEITFNKIRTDLEQLGMKSAWLYHQENNRNQDDFSCEFESDNYDLTDSKDLEASLNQIFDNRLDILAHNSSNPNVLKAKDALDKKRAQWEERSRSL